MARAVFIGLAVLLGAAGVAWGDRPKIAILGLEVAPGPSGTVDPGVALIAREVTRELRQRVQSPTSPYAVAPNSNRELIDEKLLMSCETEATECMVVIGAGLASDAVLYGRVEKRGDGFRVSLKLLDVRRKQVQPAVDELTGGGGVAGVSRRLYHRLIGDRPSSEGSVLVVARSDGGGAVRGGRVIVDDDARGALVSGKLMVPGVAEGRHTIAISADGFRRFEEIVTVRGGEQATVAALLHRESVAPPPDAPAPPAPAAASGADVPPDPALGPSPLWKVVLAIGVGAAAAGGGYAWYSNDRQQAHAALVRATVGNDRCGDSDASLLANPGIDLPAFRRACTWHSRTYVGYAIAGAGAAAAIASLIMLSRDPSPGAAGAKPELAFAPLVARGIAGAELSLAW